jgi:hypothetical protein
VACSVGDALPHMLLIGPFQPIDAANVRLDNFIFVIDMMQEHPEAVLMHPIVANVIRMR